MPDLFLLLAKKWKFIFGFTLLATTLALAATLLSPKKYLSTVTALAANSVLSDKARIFNDNIQSLYSDFGSPDELDRVIGTAKLDTVFIALSNDFNLEGHYLIEPSKESVYKAAMQLKRNSTVLKSDYGELKIKVWDKDRHMAAELANALLQKLQQMHQHLQNEANALVLQKLKKEYAVKQKEYLQLYDIKNQSGDTLGNEPAQVKEDMLKTKRAILSDQLQQYQKLINQYELALNTNPQVLLVVENARPSLRPDKPKIFPAVLFTCFGSFVFFFLLALFIESRKIRV